jgi:hypothetical protein
LDFLEEVVDQKLDLTVISLRDHLLHALEGVGVAMRDPSTRIAYDIEYPASLQFSDRDVLKFRCPSEVVTHLVFDGHFGVHRMLEKGVDIRTKQKIGRPKKAAKAKRSATLSEYIRSATCAHKDKKRATLPERTGGWQFVCDGLTGKVLVGYEHINNEVNIDKHIALEGARSIPNVSPTGLCHDDNCDFEKWCRKRYPTNYASLRDFVIDHFHKRNHKCEKKEWTKGQKQRWKGINTSACEQFNSYLRRYNFFLNSLRPSSHRFWVSSLAAHYNRNKDKIHGGVVHRSTNANERGNRARRVVRKIRKARK